MMQSQAHNLPDICRAAFEHMNRGATGI